MFFGAISLHVKCLWRKIKQQKHGLFDGFFSCLSPDNLKIAVLSKKVCKLTIILIFALSNKKQQEYGTYTRTNFGNYFELHK